MRRVSHGRGVAVLTAKQLLTWMDGRDGSSFRAMDLSRSDGDAIDAHVEPSGLQSVVCGEQARSAAVGEVLRSCTAASVVAVIGAVATARRC